MAATYMLDIVTPDKSFYNGEVDMTIFRTSTGDIGVLRDHEPTVAPLKIGAIKIKIGEEIKEAACSDGFVNIEEDHVTIITDAAEWAGEIDVERAKAAAERAKARLEGQGQGVDVGRARVSMTRAMNRVNVAQKTMNHSDL
jgi:F-type H+-transporting ATPase subunit epsilon